MSVTIQIDYRSALGPIRDQGPRPTCLSLATTVAHEYVRRSRVTLSPEYLHYFASGRGKSDGVQFSDVARALKDPGQPVEAECPYHSVGPPSDWVPPKEVLLYRRQSESKHAEVEQVSALLKTAHVPILGITLPEPFYLPIAPWIISSSGPIRALHAVAAVGQGAIGATRCFLIRNSWGSDWGDRGYAWIDDTFMVQHLRYLLTLTEEVT